MLLVILGTVKDFKLLNTYWIIHLCSDDSAHATFLNFTTTNPLTQYIYESIHSKGDILDQLFCNPQELIKLLFHHKIL